VLATGGAGVSATAAALSGTINPHGGTFTMDFEYGLTTGYGLTASAGAASGIFNTSVAGVPNGLSPSTTYHYRLRANDGAGTFFYGSDLSFTTHSLIEDWRAQNFGTIVNTGATADNASFAGDGVPNLVKYALGLDPKVANVQLLPHISLITANGTTYLSYSFARNPALVDLTYEIIAADQPAGPWSTIASSIAGGVTTGTGFIVETPGSGNQINVEVHDIVSTTDAPHRYLELRISQ
jgi:hypothetical protein